MRQRARSLRTKSDDARASAGQDIFRVAAEGDDEVLVYEDDRVRLVLEDHLLYLYYQAGTAPVAGRPPWIEVEDEGLTTAELVAGTVACFRFSLEAQPLRAGRRGWLTVPSPASDLRLALPFEERPAP